MENKKTIPHVTPVTQMRATALARHLAVCVFTMQPLVLLLSLLAAHLDTTADKRALASSLRLHLSERLQASEWNPLLSGLTSLHRLSREPVYFSVSLLHSLCRKGTVVSHLRLGLLLLEESLVVLQRDNQRSFV